LVAQARVLYTQHKYAEAMDLLRVAVERKPDVEGGYWCLGQCLFATSRFAEAAELAERAVVSAGDDYNTYVPYEISCQHVNAIDKSRWLRRKQTEVMERHLESVPEDGRARILLANNYAVLDEPAKAIGELETAVALRPNDSSILYNAACVYALLQRKQEAVKLLQRSKEAGFLNVDWASRDPDLESLHDEPEFQELMAAAQAKKDESSG
jgi:tetratricopeptide (TPR) repeat protein